MNWQSRLWTKFRAPWPARFAALIMPAASAGLLILCNFLYRSDLAQDALWLYRWGGHGILILLFFLGLLSPVVSRFVLSTDRKRYLILVSGFLCLMATLWSGSSFYSDDALRHELDGNYIVRGLPLYCMSPNELGPACDRALIHTDSQTFTRIDT